MINVKWFGHSMWKVWNDQISIITDPFTDIGYKLPVNETADIVLSSHDHFDHNNLSLIKGCPKIIRSEGKYQIKDSDIKMISVFHDESSGEKRGNNLLMKFTVSGKTFLHCGDLGHDLLDDTVSKIENIDVIFIPVGGFYTINAVTAKNIVDKLNPAIVFPMHYKTEVLDFPIATYEEYLSLTEDRIRKVDSNAIILDDKDFNIRQTIILDYD